jgi:ApaG protein
MSDMTTRGIRIQVHSRYEPERSSPHDDHYFFSYHVRIENEGPETARLLSRVWIVTDSHGREERIEGAGVVGETPLLAPGEAFEYTSFCPLPTSVGTMEGHYVMEVKGTGERFSARIPPFTLAVPGAVN